jgi:NAD(P)-dependent dehydrogenase (short-subunit alcohol dehydrogenase family)
MPGPIASKVVIVTGGATGIGRAVAARVASDGAAVVIGGRRRDVGKQAAGQIRGGGGVPFSSPPTSPWNGRATGWSKRPWGNSASWMARSTMPAA